jgi:hypothetical protein
MGLIIPLVVRLDQVFPTTTFKWYDCHIMKHKKILPAHHTGKIRHHRHTSYGSLTAVLLLTCLLLAVVSRSVALAAGDPVTGSNTVYAVVPGPTPTTPPAITNIPPGTVYTTNEPVTVSGTCPNGTLLKIFKNEVLAGTTLCQNGRFSIQIDLFLGSNTLIVRAYNNLDNSGPESAPVVVTKTLPGINLSEVGRQLFVTTEVYFKGVEVGQKLSWPLTIGGGQAPYAVSVAWGDGTTDLISRGTEGTFNIEHIYQEAGDGDKGSYNVTVLVTDAAGNKTFIHLVSIVGGQKPGVAATIKQGYDWSATLRIAWQIVAVAILAVFSFWLGERREIRILRKQTRTA